MAKRPTQAQLAKRYGVSARTVATWKKSGVDIYDADAVREHQASRRSQPQIPRSQESRDWKTRRERADALKAERYLEILDIEYLPRAVVERQQAEIGYVVNALLRGAISELPPLVAGLSAVKAEKVIRDWSIRWAEELKTADAEVWKAASREVAKVMRGDLKKIAAAQQKK